MNEAVVIVENGVEKCRFVPRLMDVENGYLITPPRYRPWPITPGLAQVVIGGDVAGYVKSCRPAQFQRCRVEFVPVTKKPRRKRVSPVQPITDDVPGATHEEGNGTTDGD